MKTGSTSSPTFATTKRRKVDVTFDGGDITSDAGGALLLRQAERRLGLVRDMAKMVDDPRRTKSVRHKTETMLMQRVLGIALGYEDLNDHDTLRDDLAIQTGTGSDGRLASASTLGRMERRAGRNWLWRVHAVLLDKFVSSFKKPPKELVLSSTPVPMVTSPVTSIWSWKPAPLPAVVPPISTV